MWLILYITERKKEFNGPRQGPGVEILVTGPFRTEMEKPVFGPLIQFQIASGPAFLHFSLEGFRCGYRDVLVIRTEKYQYRRGSRCYVMGRGNLRETIPDSFISPAFRSRSIIENRIEKYESLGNRRDGQVIVRGVESFDNQGL